MPQIVFDRSGPGAYVPLARAAELMGVHRDALRRQARAHQVDAKQVKRAQGLAWEVWLPEELLAAPPPAPDELALVPRGALAVPRDTHVTDTLAPALVALAAASEKTASVIESLARDLARATARAETAEAELAALRARPRWRLW